MLQHLVPPVGAVLKLATVVAAVFAEVAEGAYRGRYNTLPLAANRR